MTNYLSDQNRASELHGWHVYVLTETGEAYSKIGSALNYKYRVEGIQGGNPRKLILCAVFHFKSRAIARQIEAWALGRADFERVAKRDWLNCPAVRAIALVRDAIKAAGVEYTEVKL